MKKFTKFCVITGLVLCVLGGSALAAGAAGGAWNEVSGKGSAAVGRYAAESGAVAASSASITLDPQEYAFLEFQLSNEDIVLKPSTDGNIHIRYTDHSHVRYHTRTQTPADGATGSTFVFSRMELDSAVHFGFTFASDDQIQVSVPQGIGVSISTDSGDMELENLDLQQLTISTASGEVDLSGLTVAGDLLVSSVSGDLDFEDSTVSGSTHLETTSGELELEHCQLSGTSVYTVSGDVSGSAQVAGDLSLDTTSGDITLNLQGSPAHRRGTISTASGDLSLEGLSDEGPYVLDIDTVSGDIHIK